MAEFGGFFNSSKGDRKYKAEHFANYFKTFIGTGISPTQDSLKVIRISDNLIKVLPGSGCINGYLYLNSAQLEKSIDTATDRIDRVVLRLNLNDRTLNIAISKGTISAPPNITQNNLIHEISLAQIIIKNNSIAIQDERGQTICPYMKFLGKDDLQSMWDKFNTEWGSQKNIWQDWFQTMQGKSIRGIYNQPGQPVDAKVGDIWI